MAEPPKGQVLMPADMARGIRFLDDVGHVVEKDVRSDYGFDDVQHRRVRRQLQRRCQNGVRFRLVVQRADLLFSSLH